VPGVIEVRRAEGGNAVSRILKNVLDRFCARR
jgi:hypothetical protein